MGFQVSGAKNVTKLDIYDTIYTVTVYKLCRVPNQSGKILSNFVYLSVTNMGIVVRGKNLLLTS